MKKIISILATVSMLASMFVVTASAASTPTISLNGKVSDDKKVLELTMKYTNSVDTEKISGINEVFSFDTEYLSFESSSDDIGAAANPVTEPSNVKYIFAPTSPKEYLAVKDKDLTTIKFNILKDIDKPIKFTTSKCTVTLTSDDVNDVIYGMTGENKVTVNDYTLLPDAKITVTSSATEVEKGSSIDVTATAANFETVPTEFSWTVEGKTSKDTKVEGNGAKATLTVGQDETASKLTVVATSGDVSGSAVVNVVDKKYPLEINADTFKDDETTITITPGSDYVADTEYTVTVQFYAEDGTASAWVTQSGLKNNATLTVGAQGAAKANVKAVTTDGTIIGSMQQQVK